MRLANWNCKSGELRERAREMTEKITPRPDVMVLQECGRPSDQNDQCVWMGDPNGAKGIGVVTRGQWTARILPPRETLDRFFVGIQILGPVRLAMLAVCINEAPYAPKLRRAIDAYSDFLKSCPSLILGDFNMDMYRFKPEKPNKPPQQYPDDREFIKLSSDIESEFQVVSATKEQPRQNTYYHFKRKGRVHQIDHCFVPREPIASLEQKPLIGDFETWVTNLGSDHVPLIVDLRFN